MNKGYKLLEKARKKPGIMPIVLRLEDFNYQTKSGRCTRKTEFLDAFEIELKNDPEMNYIEFFEKLLENWNETRNNHE